MKARIYVTFKKGVLEPQGKAVRQSLNTLGFKGIEEVRVGRLVDLRLSARDRKDAEAEVDQMCKKLLANPVIEDYSFEIREDGA